MSENKWFKSRKDPSDPFNQNYDIPQKKGGRNEPIPCGSGKKHKMLWCKLIKFIICSRNARLAYDAISYVFDQCFEKQESSSPIK